MAQFDLLITFVLVWSSLVSLIGQYCFLLIRVIPTFFGARKFREKKLNFLKFNFSILKKRSIKKFNFLVSSLSNI